MGAATRLCSKQQHHPVTHTSGMEGHPCGCSTRLYCSISMGDGGKWQLRAPTEVRLAAGAALCAWAAGAEVSMESRGLISEVPSGPKGGRPPSGIDPSLFMLLKGITSVGQGAWCSRWLERLLCPSYTAWHASVEGQDQDITWWVLDKLLCAANGSAGCLDPAVRQSLPIALLLCTMHAGHALQSEKHSLFDVTPRRTIQAHNCCRTNTSMMMCLAALSKDYAHIEGFPEAGSGGRAGDDQVNAVLLQKFYQPLLSIVLHGHLRQSALPSACQTT